MEQRVSNSGVPKRPIPSEADEWLAAHAIDATDAFADEHLRQFGLTPEQIEDALTVYSELIASISALPDVTASPALKQRLDQISERARPSLGLRKRWLALLAGAAALLTWQWQLREPHLAQHHHNGEVIRTIASNNDLGFELVPAESADEKHTTLHASIIVQANKPTNLLKVAGLKQLPAGRTYRLWAVNKTGEQGCVTFQPDQSGMVVMQIPKEPTESADHVLISIDTAQAGRASDQPGRPVLLST